MTFHLALMMTWLTQQLRRYCGLDKAGSYGCRLMSQKKLDTFAARKLLTIKDRYGYQQH